MLKKIICTILVVIIEVLFSSQFYSSYCAENKKIGIVQNNKQIIFKIGNHEIYDVELYRNNIQIMNSYHPNSPIQLSQEMIDISAIDNILTKYSLLNIAKEQKIQVTDKEIEMFYKKIRNSYPNEMMFKEFLEEQEFTDKTFKEELKNNLTVQKLIDKDREGQWLLKEVVKIKKNMKIESVSPQILEFMPKTVIAEESIEITNIDIVNGMIRLLNNIDRDNRVKIADDYDLENVEKRVIEDYKRDLIAVKIARDKGITVYDNLSTDAKIKIYKERLYEKIRENIKISDTELERYLKDNIDRYKKDPIITANIGILNISPSKKDKNNSLKEAKKILKEMTEENFSKKAKDYYQDENDNVTGGDMGWVTKGNGQSKDYEKAIFSSPVGEIAENIFTNDIGSFIFYVKDKKLENGVEKVNLSQIVVRSFPSEETKVEKRDFIKKNLKKIEKEGINFKDLKKYDEKLEIIENERFQKGAEIDENTMNGQLYNALLSVENGMIKIIEIKNSIYILEKVSHIKFNKPSMREREIYEKVKNDYLNEMSIFLMERMIYEEKNTR